jgi:tetratricopeptide (TPR) repeat protein
MVGYQNIGRRKYFWYGMAALSAFLAWNSKPEAITLPIFIAGFFALVGSWRIAAWMLLVPLGLAASRWTDIINLYTKVKENQSLVAVGLAPALTPLVYFLTYIKASVFYYLRMFLVPLNQCVDPYIRPVTRPSDPLFLISALLLISLFVCGGIAARSSRAISFAILALLVSPLMAYAFMPLADVVAEHRIYISGLGFDLLVALALLRFHRQTYAVLAVILLALGLLTYQRNQVWANSLTLWKDAELKSPKLARPHLNLGLAYQSNGELDAALTEYRYALSINPKLSIAYTNIGSIYFSVGDLDKAESALKKATELSPHLWDTYMDLAVIAMRKNQTTMALELIEKASSLDNTYLVHLRKGIFSKVSG